MLVNNAGIAHGGRPFWQLPEADFARVVDVDPWGVGRQSAYCLSKFAVRGFTESLRMELRESAPHARLLDLLVRVVPERYTGLLLRPVRRAVPARSV